MVTLMWKIRSWRGGLEEGQNTISVLGNFMKKYYRNKLVEYSSSHIFSSIHFHEGPTGKKIRGHGFRYTTCKPLFPTETAIMSNLFDM